MKHRSYELYNESNILGLARQPNMKSLTRKRFRTKSNTCERER
jgi:hypothetical protein